MIILLYSKVVDLKKELSGHDSLGLNRKEQCLCGDTVLVIRYCGSKLKRWDILCKLYEAWNVKITEEEKQQCGGEANDNGQMSIKKVPITVLKWPKWLWEADWGYTVLVLFSVNISVQYDEKDETNDHYS